MPSAVSVGGGKTMRRMAGLRAVRPPLQAETASGTVCVGEGAHDWGRPVENLDFDRLTGAPEMLALFLGALVRYGLPEEPLDLIIGLPIASLMGDEAKGTQLRISEFLPRPHSWCADGSRYCIEVKTVRATSQPVGAMFDYLLDDQGEMRLEGRAAFAGEIAVLGIGMNTVDLLVGRNGSPVHRFTAGQTLGVRRLLEMLNHDGLYSLAEVDAQLRQGQLDISHASPVWKSEILGFVEKHGMPFLDNPDLTVHDHDPTPFLSSTLPHPPVRRVQRFFVNVNRNYPTLQVNFGLLYFWRAHSGLEVDFILEHGRQVLGIEVKLGAQVGHGDAAPLRRFRR